MKRWLILLLIGLMGCSPEYVDNDSISSDISFNIIDVFESTNTSQKLVPKIELIAEDYYSCNHQLITSQSLVGNELIIRFEEIIIRRCTEAADWATPNLDFPENITQLTLINGEKTDQYFIDISKEKITISPINSSFSKSSYNVKFRKPENSFAFVCGTNTDNTYIFDEFLSILQQNESFTEFEFKGDGVIPYPKTSYNKKVNFPSRFFTYSDPAAYENLKNTLKNFSKENIDAYSGISISIYGWNDIDYYSWWPYQDETD